MKNIRHLLYALLVIVLAVSCAEDRLPSGAQIADIPCVLNVDKTAISFDAEGATGQLAIKSQNVAWKLTGAPEWLTLSQSSGTDAATVTMTVVGNKDIDNSRVAVLTLESTTSKYEFSKSITVSQEAATKYINVDHASLSFAPQATQTTVVVGSNVEWEAVCSAEWVSLSKSDAAVLSVAVGENTTDGSRMATITLRCVGTTAVLATISVVQSEAGVTGSTEAVVFDVDGGTKSVAIEADVAWSATTSATSWLSVTPTSGAGGKVSLEIVALANSSTAARNGYVYVKIGAAQKLAIPVSQEGVLFNVNGSLDNFAADGGEQKLTVKSNVEWAVLSCPEWLTVTPGLGEKGSVEVTIKASENKSLNPRSATLSIGVDGFTSANKNITVTQEGVVADFGDSSLEFGWESSQKELVITLPDNWNAAVSDDWLSLSQSSGNGGETIILEVTTNDGEDGRTGTVTIVSEGRSIKISVIQQGQYLKISSTAGEVGAMGGSVSLTVTSSVGATATVEYEGAVNNWVMYEVGNDGEYTLTAVYNPSVKSRTAQFVIRPTKSGTNSTCSSGVKFAITQKGRSLSANVSEIQMLSVGGTSETYTITADGTYIVVADSTYTDSEHEADDSSLIEYTDNMLVTINGESVGPQMTTITVEKNADGTYKLALNNFNLTNDEMSSIPIGNIVLEGIVATEENGIKSFQANQEIYITAGDGDEEEWLGPKLGALPVSLIGKMDAEKLYCNIDIDMSASLGQIINVVFGNDFTAYNSSAIEKTVNNWYTLQHDAANNTFYIVVSENTTGQQRTSQLTVSLTGLPSGEEKYITIPIVQYAKDVNVDVDGWGEDVNWDEKE